MIKAVIIDDDLTNINLVKNFIQKYTNDIQVVGNATNLADGIDVLDSTLPDILFLDVELHNKTGFDILDVVKRDNLYVVVITAYEKYAVKAIKYEAIDFLLKPLQIEEFISTIQRIKKKMAGKETLPKTSKEFLTVPNKNFIELVAYQRIIYLESSNSYTYIISNDGRKLLSTRSLGEFEGELPESFFLRVHRCFVINMQEVKGFTRGKLSTLIMSNDEEIPISQNKKKEVFDLLKLD